MTTNNESLKTLFIQRDWALLALIAYCAYVFATKNTIIATWAVMLAIIIGNGWISAIVSEALYSLHLIPVDLVIRWFYFCMCITLHHSDSEIENKFWIYNSLLCISYAVWNIIFRALIKKHNENYFKQINVKLIVYTIIMFLVALIFIGSYFAQKDKLIDADEGAFIGLIVWFLVMSKWLIDRLKSVLIKGNNRTE